MLFLDLDFFPQSWSKATIVPVFKKGNVNDTNTIKQKSPWKFFLKVNLFMRVEPIVAMFINEGNMVGGAEQREVTDDNNWYMILYLKLFSII